MSNVKNDDYETLDFADESEYVGDGDDEEETPMGITADHVRQVLSQAGVDHTSLTITDDPQVWTNVFTGVSGTSVRIAGPDDVRSAAGSVLTARGLACAPYPDCDYWSD